MPRGGPRLRTPAGKKNQLGERMHMRRKELRLTRDAVTARIAYATDGVWNPALQEVLHIEDGSRTVTDLEILALSQALECSACWLLIGDPR